MVGLMRLRIASINDLPIRESGRRFHWPLGHRPDARGQSVWRELLWLSRFSRCAMGSFVCETDQGCAPLPITRAMIRALQRTDPRCDNLSSSPEDAELVKQLKQLLKAPK
jgi:hypothetical protein